MTALTGVSRWFRPAEGPTPWHISPFIDFSAYHFSWLWVLIPLAFFGVRHPVDYVGMYLFIMTANFAHRHFTLPYVYMDREVFAQYPGRFIVAPVLMFAAFFASPWLWGTAVALRTVTPVDMAILGLAFVLATQAVVLGRRGYKVGAEWLMLGLAPLATLAIAEWQMSGGVAGVGAHGRWLWLVAASVLAFAMGAGARSSRDGQLVAPTPAWRWTPLVLALATTLAMLAVADATLGVWPTAKPFELKVLIRNAAFLAVLWNLWHIHMQKFGIMRLYNAKCMASGATDVPWWVDRLFVFAWLPFYLVWLGPANRDLLLEHGPTIASNTMPLIDGMQAVQPYILPPAIALIVGSAGLFLWHEWKNHRLRNVPRLSIAAGLTLLPMSFFVFHPAKVAMAYVFTHAVEYMVFVWAFNRKRYGQNLGHRPLLQRVLSQPALAYGGFLLLLFAVYFFGAYYGRYYFTEASGVKLAGVSARRWIFYWGIFQSMIHFYYDGFLWKMRLPIYREGISAENVVTAPASARP